jgi:hypothetical protein
VAHTKTQKHLVKQKEDLDKRLVLFYQRNGFKSIQEAFGVKQPTLLKRQKQYKEWRYAD